MTSSGELRVRRDGRLDLRVEGLVIPGVGNPVASVMATLYCNGAAAATSAAFPLSPAGDARFRGSLMLPTTCVAPVVLINPAGGDQAVYIAATG